jgi:hypothetical protein
MIGPHVTAITHAVDPIDSTERSSENELESRLNGLPSVCVNDGVRFECGP